MESKKYLRVLRREESFSLFDDPETISYLSPSEARQPVKVELVDPIEIAGSLCDFLIIKPPKAKQVRRAHRMNGDSEKKMIKMIGWLTGISRKNVEGMSQTDLIRFAILVNDFMTELDNEFDRAFARCG